MIEYCWIITLLSRQSFYCLRRTDAFTGGGIKGRGRFKAYKAAFCVDGCNRGCAGANANVRDQFSGVGIGADQILAELHGLLRGVDAAGHRRHK